MTLYIACNLTQITVFYIENAGDLTCCNALIFGVFFGKTVMSLVQNLSTKSTLPDQN
jgi:hypothetical protein